MQPIHYFWQILPELDKRRQRWQLQKNIAEKIVYKNADYVFSLKGNQSNLWETPPSTFPADWFPKDIPSAPQGFP